MGPVFSEPWKDLPQQVTLGDGAINVTDHNLGLMSEEKDVPMNNLASLEPSPDCEGNVIAPEVQVQRFDLLLSRH